MISTNQLNQYKASENSMDLHSSVPRITQQSGGYTDENLTEIMSFVPPQLDGTQLFSSYQQNDLVLINQALCAPNSSILSETEKLYDQANQLNQYKASENSMGLHSSVPRITQQSGGYTDENLTEIMSFVPPQLDDTELFSSYQQNDFALINQALCAPNSSILSETEKLYDQANQLNQYKASENSMDLHSSVPQITQQSDRYTDENLTEIMSFVTPQLDDTELFSSYQQNDFALINQALCAPNSSILSETEKLYDQANQLNQYKASENSMDLHSSVPQITQQSDRYTDENLTEIMSFVPPQLDDTELFSSYQKNDFALINQALCAPNSSILSETEKLYDQANQLNQYKASENDKTSNNPPTEDEEDSETVLPVGSSNIQSLTNGAGYLPENETINNPGSSKTEKPAVKQRKKHIVLSAEKKAELCRLAPEMTYNQLSKHFNISEKTVKNILKRNGISLPKTTSQLRQFNIFKMHTNGKKACEIAKLLNLSEGHVKRVIRTYRRGNGHFPENKTTNNPGSSKTEKLAVKRRKKYVKLSAEKEVELCRLAPEMTYNQLSKHFNINDSTVVRILKRNSIGLSNTTSRLRQFDIFKMHTNGKKACEIATLLNLSEGHVKNVIRNIGVEMVISRKIKQLTTPVAVKQKIYYEIAKITPTIIRTG